MAEFEKLDSGEKKLCLIGLFMSYYKAHCFWIVLGHYLQLYF